MPRASRLFLSKTSILTHFTNASQKVYSEMELKLLLLENRRSWRLTESIGAPQFITFLMKYGKLKQLKLRSIEYNRSITRYSWGEASRLELAQSIRSRGYLCHGTAATIHGLTKPSLKILYFNVEQSAKLPNSGSLSQHGIDLAFSGKQRQSKLIYTCMGLSIVMIAGKNTNQLGVKAILGPESEALQITNLERTLIDIVVRPAYVGGIDFVLGAYRAAKDRVSVDDLLNILVKLDYVYPYHQAIGYLMQKAGYFEKSLNKFRELGLNYDFYLAHGIKQPSYSKEWRLFHPKNL